MVPNNENNSSSGGGLMTGFILGAVLGGGIIFLLGTKKGKKLLKVITEEGLEGISDVGDLIENNEEEKAFEEVEKSLKEQKSATIDGESYDQKDSSLPGIKAHAKRFFKGVGRKT